MKADKARSVLTRCQKDPDFFVREVLGEAPWEKQTAILESVRDHRRTAVRACHSSGKTKAAAWATLWFLYSHPGAKVITTAPTQRQVVRALWEQIRECHKGARFPLGGDMLQAELRPDPERDGWNAVGFTARRPDDFQGIKAPRLLVIFDEAQGIDEGIWRAADGLLAVGQPRFLAIGNPTDPSGPFGKAFQAEGWQKLRISAFDTPNLRDDVEDVPGLVTPDYVQDIEKEYGEDSRWYKVRVLGEFPSAAPDALIPLPWIERAQQAQLEPAGEVELGVDVAEYGNNETALYRRQGPHARLHAAYERKDTMETAGHVAAAVRDLGVKRAKVDQIGVGAGVYHRLREQGLPVEGIHVGKNAKDGERYANRRAELFWHLRERFEQGDIDIDERNERLAAQLAEIRVAMDSRGRTVIESKEKMAKRGVRSPDRADALMLAFADSDRQPFWVV